VADGTPQQVMETPSHEGVARLAGFENILDAVVVDRRPDTGVMLSRLAGTSVDLEVPLADAVLGQDVRVAIRAGDVLIASVRPHGLSARNVIAGVIASLTRQGPVVRVDVNVGVPIAAFVTPAATDELDLRAGREVWLVIKTHSCRPVSTL
jgi:molybdate transport system ATP-binding protein